MATHARFDTNTQLQSNGRSAAGDEPQLRDLLRQLAGEGSHLLRGEVALAKLEMKDMAREIAADSARMVSSLGVVLLGAIALLAATVIGVGHLIGDRYGLAALMVGVIMVAVGGFMARTGMTELRNGPKPHIGDSLKRGTEWASDEVRELKQGIRS